MTNKTQSCDNCRFNVQDMCRIQPKPQSLPSVVEWCGQWEYAGRDTFEAMERKQPTPTSQMSEEQKKELYDERQS